MTPSELCSNCLGSSEAGESPDGRPPPIWHGSSHIAAARNALRTEPATVRAFPHRFLLGLSDMHDTPQIATHHTESTMATNLIEREASSKTKTETLRVDHVSESRHKFVSATPHVVTVEHDGED